MYQNQLLHGKWYVDCSQGGAVHGQGMYAVGSYGPQLTSSMQNIVNGYGQTVAGAVEGRVDFFTMVNPRIINSNYLNNERQIAIYEARKSMFDGVLTKDQESLLKLMTGVPMSVEERSQSMALFSNIEDTKLVTEFIAKTSSDAGFLSYMSSIQNMDDGVFATLRGYDAIQVDVDSNGGKYFVVLNRTRCIFLGD